MSERPASLQRHRMQGPSGSSVNGRRGALRAGQVALVHRHGHGGRGRWGADVLVGGAGRVPRHHRGGALARTFARQPPQVHPRRLPVPEVAGVHPGGSACRWAWPAPSDCCGGTNCVTTRSACPTATTTSAMAVRSGAMPGGSCTASCTSPIRLRCTSSRALPTTASTASWSAPGCGSKCRRPCCSTPRAAGPSWSGASARGSPPVCWAIG